MYICFLPVCVCGVCGVCVCVCGVCVCVCVRACVCVCVSPGTQMPSAFPRTTPGPDSPMGPYQLSHWEVGKSQTLSIRMVSWC